MTATTSETRAGAVAALIASLTAPATELTEFRVTFGQRFRHEPHPSFRAAHPDGWLTILAATEDQARAVAFGWLGSDWGFIYPAPFTDIDWPLTFPLGELHRIEVQS